MTPFVLQLVQILQALMTLVIGGIVAYIAWQQWTTNALKLNLDRYDRRLRVYEEVVGFLSVVIRKTAEADFLFGQEIPTYTKEIAGNAVALRVAREQYRDYTQIRPEGYDHEKVVATIHDLEQWFSRQFEVAFDKFKLYLKISDD